MKLDQRDEYSVYNLLPTLKWPVYPDSLSVSKTAISGSVSPGDFTKKSGPVMVTVMNVELVAAPKH